LTTVHLRENEIHLWYLNQETANIDAVTKAFAQVATPEEREQAQRFIPDAKRNEFMMTRVMIRRVLAHYVAVDEKAWEFTKNRFGAPEIASPSLSPALIFSIAHTKGVIVIATASDREIGVDVESRREKSNFLDLARSAFSTQECEKMSKLGEAEVAQRFYEYWTLKEAYIKARRMGFSIPTRHFSMHLDTKNIGIAFDAQIIDDAHGWGFKLLDWGSAHQMALAYRKKSPDEVIEIHEHTFRFE
jgi:4'-phosphopantetheinyl transferase